MMRLAALLEQLRSSSGAVTVAELAQELGTSPDDVTAMLSALRAAGKLGPEALGAPGSDACTSSGSCGAGPCPGPSTCPFVVRFGSMLEVK